MKYEKVEGKIGGNPNLHLVNFAGSNSSGVSGNDKSSKLMIKSETSSAWIGAIISEHKNFAPGNVIKGLFKSVKKLF